MAKIVSVDRKSPFYGQVKAGDELVSVNGRKIRDVLDYRNWYEFQLMYERDGEPRKELTDRAFNKFSGGEKAMAMYVPLFAAVSAQYQKGSLRNRM